jgi:phosphohistidine phosphatase
MEVYFLRHSDALTKEQSGVSEDIQRPLSEQGRREAERLGMFLKNLGINFHRIFVSPAVRARQTAEIALKPSQQQSKIVIESALHGSAETLLGFIASVYPVSPILLVGHEPVFSQVVHFLLYGKRDEAVGVVLTPIRVGKGCLLKVLVDVDEILQRKTLQEKISVLGSKGRLTLLINQEHL